MTSFSQQHFRTPRTPPRKGCDFPSLKGFFCCSRLSFSRRHTVFTTDHRPKMSRHPEVLWAQRSDRVYLTISLPDAKDIKVKSEPLGLFSFSAVGVQGESFDFSLQLYGHIVPEGCKTNVGLRNIICTIQKQEKGWWKKLIKSDEKPAPYIKVDWNKWCDEDDEESASDMASDDDNAADAEDDESSDDEGMLYLPDLEKARGK